MGKPASLQTPVLIIGAGATGTGLARDLALRGVASLVVEKSEINAGASGANHGLLHSGARYVMSDAAAALECHAENLLLKRLAPHCVEPSGGLFVALQGDDEAYLAGFADACRRCGVPARPLDVREAREMEPALGERIVAVYAVDDATVDPFRLSLDNMASAERCGAKLLTRHRVLAFERDGRGIRRTTVCEEMTGKVTAIEAAVVVNAAGAWAGLVAGLAGAPVEMQYSKGSMLITHNRLTTRVINRLRPAASGDILAPGGTVSILGTTSVRVDSPDRITPDVHEVETLIDQGAAMLPELAHTRYVRAFCGVRPLLSGTGKPAEGAEDRRISRSLVLLDHAQGVPEISNFVTITGGKLTTYRLMAERTADLVCRKIGVKAACRTRLEPLPDSGEARWTQPGASARMWLRRHDAADLLICECEMVPRSVVDEVIGQIRSRGGTPSLGAIRLRSRIGKGPCQGGFCSQRLTAHLYERECWPGDQGLGELREFLRERWRGQRPLLWDTPLAQAELLEAMHCGLSGLELDQGKEPKRS